jgi:MauM/NapG family ferredoxin protein
MNFVLLPRGPSGWWNAVLAVLRRIGPTWRASPERRLVQVLALALYLVLFLYVAWPYAEVFDSSVLSSKEFLPAELFLLLDPLAVAAAAVAAGTLSIVHLWTVAILVFNSFVPRGFCSHLCPLGTLVDFFDWLVWKRMPWLKLESRGQWAQIRYWVLAAVLASSAAGVMLTGYFAAIPLLNRGLRLTVGALELGVFKHWEMLRPLEWTSHVAIAILVAVFLLGLLGGRFWCRYVCPTGALFSLANALRFTGQKVGSSCVDCGKCAKECPFDAIRADSTKRGLDCTTCHTCHGVCPTASISFGWRWDRRDAKETDGLPEGEITLSRRALLVSAAGGLGAAAAVRTGLADGFRRRRALLRPPGSAPEHEFLDLCVRCGECMKVCPGPVLHPAGLADGFEALWTPIAVPTWAGCHQDCNFCTQVCPTDAIRPLAIEEKRKTAMGLAVVDTETCLGYAGIEECRVCYEVCQRAGYDAIHLREIELEIHLTEEEEASMSFDYIEQASHILAPVVDKDSCVGCGQCESRCHTVNHLNREDYRLALSAIVIIPENAGNVISGGPESGRGSDPAGAGREEPPL